MKENKIQMLRESREYFGDRTKSKVSIGVLTDNENKEIILDGRKTLMTARTPEEHDELLSTAERIPLSMAEAKKYFRGCLNLSWKSLDGESKRIYLNKLADDYLMLLKTPIPNLVKEIAETINMNKSYLRTFLKDEYKDIPKSRVCDENHRRTRISKKDIKIKLLEEEIARLKSGQNTDFFKECRNMPVSHCKEMILQKEQGLVKPEPTVDDKVEEQFREQQREATRERVQEFRDRKNLELKEKFKKYEESVPADECSKYFEIEEKESYNLPLEQWKEWFYCRFDEGMLMYGFWICPKCKVPTIIIDKTCRNCGMERPVNEEYKLEEFYLRFPQLPH